MDPSRVAAWASAAARMKKMKVEKRSLVFMGYLLV